MPNTDNRKFGADPIDIRDLQKSRIAMSRDYKNKGKAAIKEDLDITNEQIDESLILEDAGLSVSHINPIPPVTNQLGEGSCIAFAVGYYAMSSAWYKKLGSSSFSNSVNVFSPEYLFNNITTSVSCSGSAMITALRFVENNGCVLYATLPYEQGNCTIVNSAPQIAEALTFKMSPYIAIPATDVAAIKAALADGNCLPIQITVDDFVLNPTAPYIWTFYSGIAYDSHGVCIVGYDDTKGTGGAFKVVNQWGTGWGESGFFWIAYDHLKNISSAAFLFKPAASTTAPIADAGYDKTVPAGSTTSLDASASRALATGAAIKTWAWTQVSGPTSATINSTTTPVTAVTALTTAGYYKFRITITDTNDVQAFDDVIITVTAASTDSYTLSVSRVVSKGKGTDTLRWVIGTTLTPRSVEIQAATSTTYNTIFNVVPYSPQGTYSYVTKKTLNYRLKIVKSDGTIVYSNVVHS